MTLPMLGAGRGMGGRGVQVMEYYTSEMAGSGQRGICGKCKKGPTKEGHDGCLGTLPGVMNACCGHGDINDAYVMFDKDKTMRHEHAREFCLKHGISMW